MRYTICQGWFNSSGFPLHGVPVYFLTGGDQPPIHLGMFSGLLWHLGCRNLGLGSRCGGAL